MADAVTSQTIEDGIRRCVMKFTNLSDGTGEAAVLKVDVSGLSAHPQLGTCTGVKIRSVKYDIFGMSVSILWDATTDVPALILAGYGKQDFYKTGIVPNNAGAGKTGDVLFTTNGASAGDTYSVTLDLVKVYA